MFRECRAGPRGPCGWAGVRRAFAGMRACCHRAMPKTVLSCADEFGEQVGVLQQVAVSEELLHYVAVRVSR